MHTNTYVVNNDVLMNSLPMDVSNVTLYCHYTAAITLVILNINFDFLVFHLYKFLCITVSPKTPDIL